MPVQRRSREALATARLGAQFHELVDGRDPLHLHAVVVILAAEECLVGERRIEEVPHVLVLLVEIAEAGEEAPELGRHAVGRAHPDAVRLLDRHLVVGREGRDEVAREFVVHVGVDRELGLSEAEAALAGPGLRGGKESGERVLGGIVRGVRIASLQHHGDRGVERGDGIGRCRGGAGRRPVAAAPRRPPRHASRRPSGRCSSALDAGAS